MFLKSIEIRGFKSFADRTKLDFRKGITAVVGPNGSGKSNVSDAIRWVLGEQSAKTLRGGRMDDVIFAGTQYRKSLGLAQVTLTLDNTDNELPLDYSEVTIVRRIFRSGESEYLINNNQCRLKDIISLFMDTGIGKEGYSLIGQGKIDAILNGRQEDRRALLEEAAGIVKYKSRKDESEKKLQKTNDNLVRIDDILSTYEERLEPLRIENEKAEEFLLLSSKLKEKQLSLLVNNIRNINDELDKIESNLKSVSDDNDDLIKDRDLLKESIAQLDKSMEEMDSLDMEQRRDFYKSRETVSDLKSETALLQERLSNIDELIKKNDIEKNMISEKIESINKEKSNVSKSIDDAKKNLDVIISKIDEINFDLNNISTESEDDKKKFNSTQHRKIELMQLSSNKKNDLAVKEEQIKNISSSIDNIKEDNNRVISLMGIKHTTREQLSETLDVEKNKKDKFINDIKTLKKELNVIRNNINNNEGIIRNLNNDKNKIHANKSVLINLENQYEGYNKSVKNLFQYGKRNKIDMSSCKILGDIITVDKDYETAIEISLGGAISDVITDTEINAKNYIEILKKEKLGRITFLPLNIMQGKVLNVPDAVKSLKGYVGIASELVKFDDKYTPAIRYVLGRIIIASSMDDGFVIAKKMNYSCRIVTQKGEVINPGGALTGGSIYAKHSSIITRKREIDELSLKEKEVESNIEETSKLLNELKSKFSTVDEEILSLNDEIHSIDIEIAKLDNRINSLLEEENSLKINASKNLSTIETLCSNLYKTNKSKEEIISDIEKFEQESKKNDEILIELSSKMNRYDEISTNIKEKLTNYQIKKAKADESLLSLVKDQQRIEEDLKHNLERISSLDQSTNDSNLNKSSWIKKISDNDKEIEEITKSISDIEKMLDEREITRNKMKDEYKRKSSEVETMSMNIRKLEEQIHKVDIVKAKKEEEIKSYLSELENEYEMTYTDALAVADMTIDVESYISQVKLLKKKITLLGSVNVAAIEEYKEVREKFKFMSEQREDLTKSKEELISVIEELTEKMNQIFNENFKTLNVYFNETFKELFRGGSAELKLSSDDALKANIEINVEPPGKKVQNINLMSGGEKVLSAIALVFAILKMKPTPFCVLDEIEAALDDANVARYADFLKRFSDNIQFIVITHRKGTMEAADILYGITMQEKGISKVVSVDLT